MLFLGAGASKPFDIDDLSGITLKVKESVSPALKNIIEQFEEIFNKNKYNPENFKLDIEVLLTLFDCLVNRKGMLNELGPFALLMHHFTENISKFRSLEISEEEYHRFKDTVLSTLDETIRGHHCNKQGKWRALQLYDEIYNIPIRNNHQFPNAMGKNTLSVFDFVATINYDLVLEIYGTKTSIAGVPKFVTNRGFKSIVGGIPVLDIAGIMEGDQNPSYVKLHGSIDWWQNDSGQIIASLEGQENPFEILTERTIIYPIYEKHVTKDPFFTLYQYFRKRLFREDIVIVIGYSFRDLTLNNAFSDWLAHKPGSRLIVSARESNHEIIRRIIENNKANNKVEFIDG